MNEHKKNPPKKKCKTLPVVLVEWPRKDNEVVRIELTDYKGRKGLNIRVWFRAEGAPLRPTRIGIWLPLERLSQVRKGLRKAKEIAAELGLIEQETSS
jgi:Transcriptional Coactivator p15 (PC4)